MLAPALWDFVVDATLGYAADTSELLNAVLPGGRSSPWMSIRLNCRPKPTPVARHADGRPHGCRSNFAGLRRVLAEQSFHLPTPCLRIRRVIDADRRSVARIHA